MKYMLIVEMPEIITSCVGCPCLTLDDDCSVQFNENGEAFYSWEKQLVGCPLIKWETEPTTEKE